MNLLFKRDDVNNVVLHKPINDDARQTHDRDAYQHLSELVGWMVLRGGQDVVQTTE